MVKFIQRNWMALAALVIALLGGVPGVLQIIKTIKEKPNLIVNVENVGSGNMHIDNEKFSFLFLTLTISNESNNPLTPRMFRCFIKHNSKWIHMEPYLIPPNPEFLSDDQKIHVMTPDRKDLARFLGSFSNLIPVRGYLLFATKAVDEKTLLEITHIPKSIKLICEDILGNQNTIILSLKCHKPDRPIAYPKHGLAVDPK